MSTPRAGRYVPTPVSGTARLRIVFLARDLQSFIDEDLNNQAGGRVLGNDLHYLDLSNFRSAFGNGVIVVSFDYHAGARGGKKSKDWRGHDKTYYTPWATESGTIQAGVHVQMLRWTLTCY